ncbi:MAG: NAD(P)-binding domain-containing protein [Kiritimatiellaeota bacterium]|nr:NAD(P)-binding domain-containing protein [Kiritimatiellota bacterium]
MKKVLIPTKLDTVAAETLRAHGGYEVTQDFQTPLETLAASHPDAYALIVRSEKITAATMDALPALRVIVRAGAGYDTIDTRHARKRGIDVMNTPGANANAVAEEVLAMLLADFRHIVAADASTRAGGWEKTAFMGRELTGKTVGIVGLGNIGRLVAKRLRGFECRLLGYDPVISAERAADAGIEMAPLETIFREADAVTLHIPGGDATRGLVNRTLLESMKKGATLINCARHGIIDEDALRALKKERGIRFLNDVYPKDEPGPKPVADIADIMLPHLGASTREANHVAAERAAQELIDLDDKGVTSCIVNRDIPDNLDRSFCELAYLMGRLARGMTPGAPVRNIETTFYGTLAPFDTWLLVSTLSGLDPDFDRYADHKAALAYLADAGIGHVNRKGDNEKGYSNSITLDLIAEESNRRLRRLSLRGTVAEGVPMISRIDEFNHLYLNLGGPTLFCVYDDRPGVIATISRRLADQGVNIEDMRNPHDPRTQRSLVIFKLDQRVTPALLNDIAKDVDAKMICFVEV